MNVCLVFLSHEGISVCWQGDKEEQKFAGAMLTGSTGRPNFRVYIEELGHHIQVVISAELHHSNLYRLA